MDLVVHKLDGYELLGSGGGRKLERFGSHVLDRPAPQAIWSGDPAIAWDSADAAFARGEGGAGDWSIHRRDLPGAWQARIGALTFEIRLTGFGNVGLFPEHAAHFPWIAERLAGRPGARVLNLFAYTGAASIACAAAGAEVVHVDAARAVNGWAMVNGRLSGAAEDAIRFLAEDAAKLVKREARRGTRYDAIILDPPTFGRGTKGEVWKIERDLQGLLAACRDLLADPPLFVLLTAHSPGVTPAVLANLLQPLGGRIETGEMLLAGQGPALPAGAFARLEP